MSGVLPDEEMIKDARKAMSERNAKIDLKRTPLQMEMEAPDSADNPNELPW